MPSERRLHPWSIVFTLGVHLRQLAIPIVLALVAGSRTGAWEFWTVVILVPSVVMAVVRYVAFRYEFGETELVIRSGILFRNERHVPYARIQNLDARQNALQRLLGVVDVHVDTGSGGETEAHLRVITWAAYEDMRRHVLGPGARRSAAGPGSAAAAETDVGTMAHAEGTGGMAGAAAPDRPAASDVLTLGPGDLALHGLIENRATVIISAALGLLWEVGALERVLDRYVGGDTAVRGVIRDVFAGFARDGVVPWDRVLFGAAVVATVLLVARALSVAWAMVRLWGFRLRRVDGDLRTTYGLLTRVSTTVPLHRIQTLTVKRGWLDRAFGRATVRVETAGGLKPGERGAPQREALAPIIRMSDVPAFLARVLPELDLSAPGWHAPAPRAARRAFIPRAFLALLPVVPAVALGGWRGAWLLALTLGWAAVASRVYVAHQRWALVDGAVLFRTGWLRSQLTIARVTKIQSVMLIESPFDRRQRMARVSVDTAGATQGSHRVDVPYIARPVAAELQATLAARAAATAFRW